MTAFWVVLISLGIVILIAGAIMTYLRKKRERLESERHSAFLRSVYRSNNQMRFNDDLVSSISSSTPSVGASSPAEMPKPTKFDDELGRINKRGW